MITKIYTFKNCMEIFLNACINGHFEIVKYLCKKGKVNVSSDNEFAFGFACKNGHYKIAKWLYKFSEIKIQK